MKRLILFELIVLFLATTFESDSPPGWYQQTLPVNDQINDIFFLDSLTGWVVTDGRTNTNDTGYIMKTINGGENWTFQYNQPMKLNVVQFLDNNTGYVGGGSGSGTGRIFKTTNSGNNWINISSFAGSFTDISFVNHDTGWICDDNPLDGGIYKTMNGGLNWQNQLGASYSIRKMFFINKDTGWATSNETNSRLLRTTNSGLTWSLQYTFSANPRGLFFVSGDTGFTGGFKTTNGGFNWTVMNNFQGIQVYFVNGMTGWTAGGLNVMQKTNDGLNWYNQTVPAGGYQAIQFLDTQKGWSGGSMLIHTSDGGGPIVGITPISSEVPASYELFQNYPNPFNPVTKINYDLPKDAKVNVIIYDILGRKIKRLVNNELKTAGTYIIDFNAANYASGVYFYRIEAEEPGGNKFVDSKKMVLLK